MEKTLSIFYQSSHIQLLSPEIIKEHQKKYFYLHVGLIQVAVKPLVKIGLNVAALISVRDVRHNNPLDQIFGMIETSLHQGPAYFNCGPDLTKRFQDSNVSEATTLSIYTQGFDMKPGSHYLAVIYSVHYQVMNTLFPNSVIPKSDGETTLFQLNPRHNLYIPRTQTSKRLGSRRRNQISVKQVKFSTRTNHSNSRRRPSDKILKFI